MWNSEIADVMVEDHERIDRMVDELFRGSRSAEEVLWAVEKHFFMEEKGIVNMKGSADPEERSVAMKLIREHDNSLLLLRDIVELETTWNSMVTKFKAMMMAHSKFEDEYFYPALDKNMARTKREHMISKIGEMVEI